MLNRATLTLDIGKLMGGIVGDTESNTRDALRTVDAMSPCILFIDEVEKGLSGASSGSHDSGVSQRLFGTVLQWMNDHETDVFVIATCNDIMGLPTEFTRAERFDGVWFVDMPTAKQRKMIWSIYRNSFKIDPADVQPDDSTWTGAEIKACCKLANRLRWPLQRVSRYIVPVYKSRHKQITKLRKSGATSGYIDAETGNAYEFKPAVVKSTAAADTSVGLAQGIATERPRSRVTRRTKGN
jgi:SpoVK/Ycf46/Vps4 family AAA+-type ATPase